MRVPARVARTRRSASRLTHARSTRHVRPARRLATRCRRTPPLVAARRSSRHGVRDPARPPRRLDLAAEFLDRRTPLERLRSILHRYPAISPAIVLVLAIIVFGIINPRFCHPANLSLITQQVAVVGTLAIAQTLIILTAGIDLSVGAAMVLASMVIAQITAEDGLPAPAGARCSASPSGSRAGALNGFLVTRLKLPPFIVTLGTLNIFIALTLLYSKARPSAGADMPDFTARGPARVRVRRRAASPSASYHARRSTSSSPSPSARPPGAGTSTRSATTRRPRAWPASASTGC